jgi:hypothetical protein
MELYLKGTRLRNADTFILLLVTIFWAHFETVCTGYLYNCFGSLFFDPNLIEFYM